MSNALMKKHAQPLPRIDDTLDVLAVSCWFSTLDLPTGMWRLMTEIKKKKTAFTIPFGLYHFKVMPFGLCNVHATFQPLMELVLSGLHWTSCLVYLDDNKPLGLLPYHFEPTSHESDTSSKSDCQGRSEI